MQSRVIEDRNHPIRYSSLSRAAWKVVLGIREAGHEVFVVGGTIRDLLLHKTPKDYDLLTSADLKEITQIFSKAAIIGKRFPICQVRVDHSIIEVSSFSTNGGLTPVDFVALQNRLQSSESKSRREPKGSTMEFSRARQQNAMSRDFTVNALLYDPCSQLLFDYCNGLYDLEHRQLRTIGDPEASFLADPARMLRAIRFAARVGLSLTQETAMALEKHAAKILSLPEARIQMELNAILAYGSAARSIQLMWHFGVLEVLLPAVAQHLKQCEYPRTLDTKKQPLMLQLLKTMDSGVNPRAPVGQSVYTTILACPLVLDSIDVVKKKIDAAQRMFPELLSAPKSQDGYGSNGTSKGRNEEGSNADDGGGGGGGELREKKHSAMDQTSEGKTSVELRRLKTLIQHKESVVYSHLVEATLRSLSTTVRLQVFPKLVRGQALTILRSLRNNTQLDQSSSEQEGFPSPWEKLNKKGKVDKGEVRVLSVLKQERLNWSEAADIGITKLCKKMANSAPRTK